MGSNDVFKMYWQYEQTEIPCIRTFKRIQIYTQTTFEHKFKININIYPKDNTISSNRIHNIQTHDIQTIFKMYANDVQTILKLYSNYIQNVFKTHCNIRSTNVVIYSNETRT